MSLFLVFFFAMEVVDCNCAFDDSRHYISDQGSCKSSYKIGLNVTSTK